MTEEELQEHIYYLLLGPLIPLLAVVYSMCRIQVHCLLFVHSQIVEFPVFAANKAEGHWLAHPLVAGAHLEGYALQLVGSPPVVALQLVGSPLVVHFHALLAHISPFVFYAHKKVPT